MPAGKGRNYIFHCKLPHKYPHIRAVNNNYLFFTARHFAFSGMMKFLLFSVEAYFEWRFLQYRATLILLFVFLTLLYEKISSKMISKIWIYISINDFESYFCEKKI